MGEHILKIGIRELKTARMTCKKCKATAEVAIDDEFSKLFTDCQCPFCDTPYLDGGASNPSPFEKLQSALKAVCDGSNLDFQFVIPAERV